MDTLKLATAVVLCGPGVVAALGLGVLRLLVWVRVSSPLAYLGVIGLGAAYLVPFALVGSAIGLALAQWALLAGHEGARVTRMSGIFLTGVLVSCAAVALMLTVKED